MENEIRLLSLASVAVVAGLTTLGSTTSYAEPLDCTYEYEYAPGPADLDPDGDGIWFEDGSNIEQRGAIIGVIETCSGIENEEVEP